MVRYYFDDFSRSRADDDSKQVAHFESEDDDHRIGITCSDGKWVLWSRGEVIDINPRYEDLFIQAQALWALKPEPSKALWIDLG